MLVDPMKPILNAPGRTRLKLEHVKLLSNFAFNFNLRRYRGDDTEARGQEARPGAELRGRAVQVDPMKPRLKAPGTMLLKLRYDEPHSNFAFNFNLRLYNVDMEVTIATKLEPLTQRGEDFCEAKLAGAGTNGCYTVDGKETCAYSMIGAGQGLTLFHFSAQPEPFLSQNYTLNTPSHPPTPRKHPLNTP